MGGSDQSNLFHDRDFAVITDFWHESANIGIPLSFYLVAYHNGWEDRVRDAHVNMLTTPFHLIKAVFYLIDDLWSIISALCKCVCVR